MNEKTRFMLALIAPAALVLVLFQVVPILTGANASFRDWTLHDPKRTWVGLANYIHVLRDAEFLGIVLPNTFGFMFASVTLSLLLGLAIALMLNKRFPGRWLVQSFVLLPLMVAPVIAAIMIRWMFNDQFGVVNAAVEGLGFAPVSWLTQRWTTFFVILLTDVWLWTISGGGPARATELFSLYAYVESFQFLNLGRGSAAAVIGAVIIVIFALLLYRLLNRFVEVSK